MPRIVYLFNVEEELFAALAKSRSIFLAADEILMASLQMLSGEASTDSMFHEMATKINAHVTFDASKQCTDYNVLVVYFNIQPDMVTESFLHLAYGFPIFLSEVAAHKRCARKDVVQIARKLTAVLARARGALRLLSNHVLSHDRRTPLLLPMRCFDRRMVASYLLWLATSLLEDSEPQEKTIKRLTGSGGILPTGEPIETQRIDRRNAFVNSRGWKFVATRRGLARHGIPNGAKPHRAICRLNGLLRLGAPFDPRFHYDCEGRRPIQNATLDDCHDVRSAYTGDPHLNIYVNDFIRI